LVEWGEGNSTDSRISYSDRAFAVFFGIRAAVQISGNFKKEYTVRQNLVVKYRMINEA